jgi:ABC-type polar amino acid transport system ATPase subunit
MVFQQFNLFWHMTLLDNVSVGPRTVLGLSKDEAQDQAIELLNKVGLSDKMESYPQSLSGGQQQRGAIARALAMEPKLMLFDEPTSALDPDMSREVVSVVEKLAKDGMTMIIVSHEMSFVRRAATRVVMMNGGTVTEDLRDFRAADLSATNGIGAYLNATL